MSKELEALEKLKQNNVDNTHLFDTDLLNIIENAFKRLEKQDEILRIIKEKFVIPAYIWNSENVEKYNKWLKQITFRKDFNVRKLTQEEYDLLKEVLL